MQYDPSKVYVAMIDGYPAKLVHTYHPSGGWWSFDRTDKHSCGASQLWMYCMLFTTNDPQECIDKHTDAGHPVYVFDTEYAAFEFMLKRLSVTPDIIKKGMPADTFNPATLTIQIDTPEKGSAWERILTVVSKSFPYLIDGQDIEYTLHPATDISQKPKS